MPSIGTVRVAAASVASLLFVIGRPTVGAEAAKDPVAGHFAAYSTGLRANEFEQAEAALRDALAASIARDGDGGRTADLSLELARLSLLRDRPAAALEPARRAVRIVDERGLAAGIDRDVARLTLARAELRSGEQRGSDQSLLDLLGEVPYSPENAVDLLAAARDLAEVSDAAGRTRMARQAWARYGQLLQRRPKPDVLLLVSAQVGEARAAILERVRDERQFALGDRLTPTGDRAFGDYARMLVEASELVGPEARRWVTEFEPTPAQRLYAEAAAWLGVIDAKLRSENREPVDADRRNVDGLTLAPAAFDPLCDVRIVAKSKPAFPSAQAVMGGVGAVTLKLRFDDSGGLLRFTVVTSAGGPEFEKSVTAVVPTWRIERKNPTVPGRCRMARDVFVNALYVYS